MVESYERGVKPVTGRNLRPRSVGHVWAWIAIAVWCVIFQFIYFGVISVDHQPSPRLMDKEVVHNLAGKISDRWPQVPGPPEVYVEQARTAMARGDLDVAARRTTMALALDGESEESWFRLVALSSQPLGTESVLSIDESEALLNVIASIPGEHPGITTAYGWLAYRKGESERALEMSVSNEMTFERLLLRWHVLGKAAETADIEALLQVAPGHAEACVQRIERGRIEHDDEGVRKWSDRCSLAGVDPKGWESNSETLDSTTVAP